MEQSKNQVVKVDKWGHFELPDDFIEQYRNKEVPWGFGDMSWVTYKRTYARKKDNGEREEWFETCRRVIEGMFTVQRCHCLERSLPWDNDKALRFAKKAYDKLFHFKWTPPGRGLWTMGTEFIFERGGACANNCSFTSTKDIDDDMSKPFTWALQMSMLGVGVGYDTRGAGEVTIQEPEKSDEPHVIGDSREGWAKALGRLLDAFVGEDTLPSEWDYSEIRPKGAPIESFGGTASGPEPLKELLTRLESMYRDKVGEPIDSELIVDTFNLTGKCVVAGGVRRSAMISLGDKDDEDFLDLKLDEEKVMDYRWASNNSVFADVGMDYSDTAKRTATNGEPGYMWLENARKYGRMKDEEDHSDEFALGSNPCVTGDTKVATSEGWIPIQELEGRDDLQVWQARSGDDPVLSHYEEIVSRGQKDVWKIDLEYGASIKCTADHEFITKQGKVEAQNLDETHDLIMPTFNMEGGQVCKPDLAEVMGMFIGDGNFSDKSKESIVLSFWGEDREMSSYYLDLMRSLRREPKTNIDYPLSISSVEDRNKESIKTSLIEVPEELEDDKLQVPDFVYRGDIETRCKFLRGLFSADGSVQLDTEKGHSVRLTSISENLLEGVQKILSSVGVNSKLYTNRNKNRNYKLPDGKGGQKQYDCKPSHEIVIAGESIQKYKDLVGFSPGSYRNDQLEDLVSSYTKSPDSNDLTRKVKSKEYVGTEEVFDVVNSHSTTFIADGVWVSNCVEQTLWDKELCTLVETYPAHHENLEEYKDTLKIAYQYAKTVTLIPTHSPETNAIMLKNRRIGCSMTGIVQAINKHGYREFLEWCDEGYEYIQSVDKKYSDWLCIPRSIKTTSVKPSGTVSLLAGSTPGVHWGHSKYYIRRIRAQEGQKVLDTCEEAGYPIIDDPYSENTKIIEFPVEVDHLARSKSEVPVWEKVDLAAKLQYYWADNQVSCTAEFDPDDVSEDDMKRLLEMYEGQLKGISFLPSKDHGYDFPPYQKIGKEEYDVRVDDISPVNRNKSINHDREDKFCSGESCKVDPN